MTVTVPTAADIPRHQDGGRRRTGGPIFTVGYQGATLDRVLDVLAAAEISVLVDTRERPTSRRPEFRSRSLDASLATAGIRYVSMPALGAPRDLRDLVSDWDTFADGYRARLGVVREELESLIPLIESERVCFLCFEADPLACHRSLLAHEIQTLLDVGTVHLRPGRIDQPDDVAGREVRGRPDRRAARPAGA